MRCQADILLLAHMKMAESNCLFAGGFYDGAFYLAGYAVELLLKAMVCKTLGIDDFFVFGIAKKKELYKPYKVHNYEELLILSGIYPDYVIAQKNINFKADWSVVSSWSEESRYLSGKGSRDVKDFLTSVQEIVKWIESLL